MGKLTECPWVEMSSGRSYGQTYKDNEVWPKACKIWDILNLWEGFQQTGIYTTCHLIHCPSVLSRSLLSWWVLQIPPLPGHLKMACLSTCAVCTVPPAAQPPLVCAQSSGVLVIQQAPAPLLTSCRPPAGSAALSHIFRVLLLQQ